jgi:hypothetical protein
MDVAQTTLDNLVDQVNQLGHNAMETAYDVDSLFSEWRCQNCGQEGRADLSEDGQVAFSGDLLEMPQGCTMPQGPPPDPNDPAAAVQTPVDPNAQQAAPAPAQPAQDPSQKQASGDALINDTRPSLNKDNAETIGDNQEEKLTQIVESILSTNPGMNAQAARVIARDTLAHFPSVVKTASSTQCEECGMECNTPERLASHKKWWAEQKSANGKSCGDVIRNKDYT